MRTSSCRSSLTSELPSSSTLPIQLAIRIKYSLDTFDQLIPDCRGRAGNLNLASVRLSPSFALLQPNVPPEHSADSPRRPPSPKQRPLDPSPLIFPSSPPPASSFSPRATLRSAPPPPPHTSEPHQSSPGNAPSRTTLRTDLPFSSTRNLPSVFSSQTDGGLAIAIDRWYAAVGRCQGSRDRVEPFRGVRFPSLFASPVTESKPDRLFLLGFSPEVYLPHHEEMVSHIAIDVRRLSSSFPAVADFPLSRLAGRSQRSSTSHGHRSRSDQTSTAPPRLPRTPSSIHQRPPPPPSLRPLPSRLSTAHDQTAPPHLPPLPYQTVSSDRRALRKRNDPSPNLLPPHLAAPPTSPSNRTFVVDPPPLAFPRVAVSTLSSLRRPTSPPSSPSCKRSFPRRPRRIECRWR